jgi:hypothetical protein
MTRESNNKLKDYESIPVVEATTEIDPNASWSEAKLVTTSQSGKYQDVPFAILFLAHLLFMGYLSFFYGSSNFQSGDSTPNQALDSDVSFTTPSGIPALLLFSITSAIAIPWAFTSLLIPKFPTVTVSSSLLFNTVFNVTIALMVMIFSPSIYTLFFGVAWIFVSLWYYKRVQLFIPYASAVLKLAASAVSSHWGIYIISIISSVISFFSVTMWVYVANGVGMFETQSYYNYEGGASALKLFFMLVSLYWTVTVLMNISQTTIAGVTATFCLQSTTASSHVTVVQALIRSLTTSFGSICFGSLLNAIITALRAMANRARNQAHNRDRGGAELLFCIISCILSLLEDIIEYFNQWNYTFIGIYGTSYLESGRFVLEMFRERGCSSIISDGLNVYVVNTMILMSGLACACIGAVSCTISSNIPVAVGVGFGFIIGIIFSAIITSTLQGAVKAVLVCYVDHPAKMQEIHPEDTTALKNSILLVFPDVREFTYAGANGIV